MRHGRLAGEPGSAPAAALVGGDRAATGVAGDALAGAITITREEPGVEITLTNQAFDLVPGRIRFDSRGMSAYR